MDQRIITRLSGLAVAGFGAALLLWIIPAHTETVSYGWLRPDTLPKICAWALAGLGLVQALIPRGGVSLDRHELTIVALVAALSALTIWGIGRFGFLITGPIFAAVLVWLIGERRPVWIVTALLGAPALTWVVVELLLGRPLP
jgi:putative tricarboxylic transport membrane protein